MKVFNLTAQYVDYKKKIIPPYGSRDYDMGFIPDRDLGLQKAGVLAFGSLPKGWAPPAPVIVPEKKVLTPIATVLAKAAEVQAAPKVEPVMEKEEKKSKK